MSWVGISKYTSLDMDENLFYKICQRLPKLMLNAKKEETVVRLLALYERLNRTRGFDYEAFCDERNSK